MSPEERLREYEKRWNRGGLGFAATFTDLQTSKDANDTAAEFFRAKIRSLVRDPAIGEALVPRHYPLGTKRLCVDTGYYETFNRDNVTLVDIKKAPIEEITPHGLKTRDAAYELDSIVFATGFDAMTGALLEHRPPRARRQDDPAEVGRGPADVPGHRRSPGFPNLFTITGPGQPVRAQQHDRLHRAARGLDRRLHHAPARAGPRDASRRRARRRTRGSSTSTRSAT